MEQNIRKLKYISEVVRKFLDRKNDLCAERDRKNDITNAVLYKLYYTKYASTQEKATIKLNKFKKDNENSINFPWERQALAKKEISLRHPSTKNYRKYSTMKSQKIIKINTCDKLLEWTEHFQHS